MDYWCGACSPLKLKGCKRRPYAIRVTNSSYTAQTTPLFVEEKIAVQDIFKLQLLKFDCKLCTNLLPPSIVIVVLLIGNLHLHCASIL